MNALVSIIRSLRLVRLLMPLLALVSISLLNPSPVLAAGYSSNYEGAIVGTGDGASFQLQGGKRRWIRDVGSYWTIYYMNGQRAYSNWSRSQVYGIPEGPWASPPPYPPADENAIIRLPNNSTAYQLQNGKRRWIPDSATYWQIYNTNGRRDYTYIPERFNRVPQGTNIPKYVNVGPPTINSLGCQSTTFTGQPVTCNPSTTGTVTSRTWWTNSSGSPTRGTTTGFSTAFSTAGNQVIWLQACNNNACTQKSFSVAVSTKKILDVPYVSQWNGLNGGGYCNPASLAMAINYYLKASGQQQLQLSDVTAKVGSWTGPTLPVSRTFLDSKGFKPDLPAGNGKITSIQSLQDIKTRIDLGVPMIVAVKNSYATNANLHSDVKNMVEDHVVVVTGYEADVNGNVTAVYINDPLAIKKVNNRYVADGAEGRGKNFRLSASAFTQAMNDWNKSNGNQWLGVGIIRK